MPGTTHTSKMAGLILLLVFCCFFIVLGRGFMGFYYKKCTLLVPYMCVNMRKQKTKYIFDNG